MICGRRFTTSLAPAATLATILGAAILAAGGFPWLDRARAQEAKTQVAPASILDSLPGDTTLLVRVRNCSDLERKFKASPFYGLKNHPDIKKFLEDIQKKMEEGIADTRAKLGFNPLDLFGLIEGEVVFAMGGLDRIAAAIAAELSGGEGNVKPGDVPLVLVANAGASAPKLREKLGKIFDVAQKDGAKKQIEDFRGGKITTLTQAKGPEDKDEKEGLERIFFGDLGSMVLVSISRPFLEQTMANLSSPAPDALTRNPDFASTQREVRSDSDFSFFLNIRPIANAARNNLKTNPLASMIWGMVEGKVLGRSLKNVGASMSLRQNDIQQVVFVNNGGAAEGILGFLKGPPFPGKPPALIPDDVDSYFTMSINIQSLYALVKDLFNLYLQMQGMGAGGPGAMDPEQFIEAQYGFKVKPVVDAIGSQLHFYARGPSAGPNANTFTVALELKDEMPVKELLSKLSMFMGGAQPQKYLDRDYYALGGPDPEGGGPAVGIADKLLVIGMRSDSVKEVIRRAGKGGKGLAESPHYQPLAPLAPPQVTLLYFQSSRAVKDLLQNLRSALNMSPEGFSVPDLTAAADVIVGSIGYSIWKDQGYYWEDITAYKRGASAPPPPKSAKK